MEDLKDIITIFFLVFAGPILIVALVAHKIKEKNEKINEDEE